MNLRLPKNFVGHPISDARKSGLREQHRFQRCFSMSHEKIAHVLQREFFRQHRNGQVCPPLRSAFADIKTNASKLTWIGEHQRALCLSQNKMVVLLVVRSRMLRLEVRRSFPNESKPRVLWKIETPFVCRAFLNCAAPRRLTFFAARDIAAAKNAVFMHVHVADLFTNAGIPLLAIVFDFGQFRHVDSLRQ